MSLANDPMRAQESKGPFSIFQVVTQDQGKLPEKHSQETKLQKYTSKMLNRIFATNDSGGDAKGAEDSGISTLITQAKNNMNFFKWPTTEESIRTNSKTFYQLENKLKSL